MEGEGSHGLNRGSILVNRVKIMWLSVVWEVQSATGHLFRYYRACSDKQIATLAFPAFIRVSSVFNPWLLLPSDHRPDGLATTVAA